MPLRSLNIRESDMKSANESNDFKLDNLRMVNVSTNRFAPGMLVKLDLKQSIHEQYTSIRCQTGILSLLPFVAAEKSPQVPKVASYTPGSDM